MREPKITLVYIYPVESCGDVYFSNAIRFVESYLTFPPEYEHKTVVVCNGGLPSAQARMTLSYLPGNLKVVGAPRTDGHNPEGRDIGAYQQIASSAECDLMLCVGSSIHFHRKGWLNRLVSAWREKGSALYGTMCSRNFSPYVCRSFMFFDPQLLRAYPYKITSHRACRAFESGWGRRNFTRWSRKHGVPSWTSWSQPQGVPSYMVTWDGIYGVNDWDKPFNVFRKGNQSNLLALDRHADEFEAAQNIKTL